MIQPEFDNVTLAIVAGGKSSRMGTDKAFVPLNGKPMIEHVLAAVTGLGNEVIIISNNPKRFATYPLPIFSDNYLDAGPLGGLQTALSSAQNPFILVVACDMPWLNRALLAHMLSLRNSADVIVPRWLSHPEPLHAVYHKNCLGPIEAYLNAKKYKVIGFYEKVRVRYLEKPEIAQFDPTGRSFANINTPEDLASAQ